MRCPGTSIAGGEQDADAVALLGHIALGAAVVLTDFGDGEAVAVVIGEDDNGGFLQSLDVNRRGEVHHSFFPVRTDSIGRDTGFGQYGARRQAGRCLTDLHRDRQRADVAPLSDATAPLTLPYRKVVLIEQTARTGIMKINPYSAFDPIPATVTLMPPVDNWTLTETVNGADITRRIGGGSAVRTVESIERRTVGTRQAEHLRPITITFRIEGFKPDEPLRKVIFDGIELEVESL